MSYSHASHEACELKLPDISTSIVPFSHASHEACELKSQVGEYTFLRVSVTPRMRRVS